jgi:hypothetical protein
MKVSPDFPPALPPPGEFLFSESGYAVDMDILPTLHNRKMLVLCASRSDRETVSVLTAELAMRGQVTVLDGGNRFQAYRVTQLLRQKTTQVNGTAKNIFIRRAFTCYQMLALLEGTPSLHQPFIIMDLLATFYDEHVSTNEARRLLGLCLREVDRLRQFAPLLVALAPPLLPERSFLIDLVCARADQVLVHEMQVAVPSQLALFPVY